MKTIDFVMPSLGADMEAGTITEWMIDAGDTVARGDIVAIVETDKADIDIEVWNSGVVAEILVPPGELVPVGTALARLAVADDSTDGEQPAVGPMPATDHQPAESPLVTESPLAIESPLATESPLVTGAPIPTERYVGAARVAASPLARRLAGERGIDLAGIAGSGPGGAVTANDLGRAVALQSPSVTAGLASPAPSVQPGTAQFDVAPVGQKRAEPGTDRMRMAIAELLARSKREIPHYYLATEIDLEVMSTWLAEVNERRTMEERILPAAVLMKAIAAALAVHREFNGFWRDGFQPGEGVHLGVAVSLRRGGLIAPAIHDADKLNVDELMAALRDVVGRARSGRLRGSEMTDPTITVSNLGDRGVDLVHGVIYPPQVALVGLGRISRRPAVVDDVVVPRRRVTATLAADHRATDGQVGARFLNTIERLLQEPEAL